MKKLTYVFAFAILTWSLLSLRTYAQGASATEDSSPFEISALGNPENENSPPSKSNQRPEREVSELEKADLTAQQSMARAAWAMFATALVQLAVGLIGLRYVYKTLTGTRDTLDVSRKVGDDNLRPWLSADVKHHGYIGFTEGAEGQERGWKIQFLVVTKNHGSSPATNVRTTMAVQVVSPNPTEQLISERREQFWTDNEKDLDAYDSIFPSDEETFVVDTFLRGSELDSLREANFEILVHCVVTYKSAHIKGYGKTILTTRMAASGYAPFDLRRDGWHRYSPSMRLSGLHAE